MNTRFNSRDNYNKMSAEQKHKIDAICDDLEKKIKARNEDREKRKQQIPFNHDEWRAGDRRKHNRDED